MPKFQAIHARVKVDDKELPEYHVQVDEDGKQVSCWIPSEAGKNFSVCWNNVEPFTNTEGQVSLDGIDAGGYFCRVGQTKEWNCSNCYISPTASRKFSFSPITFTDDEEYLKTPTANLGEIKLEVWNVLNAAVHDMTYKVDPMASVATKVHERSKKVGAHRVQFGDLEEVQRPVTFYQTTKVSRIVTFVFRYRPQDVLQANGITPPAPRAAHAEQSNKRKALEDDVIELYSSDEDEIDRHMKGLKDKLKQLEVRRAKKVKVKAEEREGPPLRNVVIDLT